MKITKTSGYSKPRYAVAVAAAMAMISVTGCTDTVRLAGEATTADPPEAELRLAGEETLADPPIVDYDGGLEMYTEPDDELTLEGEATPAIPSDDEIQLAGDVAMIEDPDTDENPAYCEPIDDDLILSGSVEVYEP